MAITPPRATGDSALAEIHNVYETLVMQEVQRLWTQQPESTGEFWADVACLALNQLPARYIRYDVDHSSHLSATEQRELAARVEEAIQQARTVAGKRRRDGRD